MQAEPTLKQQLIAAATQAGAVSVGFAQCRQVDAGAIALYERWLSEHKHGTMSYLENHSQLRNNPALLLESGAAARTVMVMAFPYYHADGSPADGPQFALYAQGDDYHTLLRQQLQHTASLLPDARICIDSAPVRERWWAVQAGVGFIGLNNQLIVPGAGSYCFLAEIITSAEIEPDTPCPLSCAQCQRCIKACPGRALDGRGGCDARRCLSYLTIEHRGELPPDIPIGNHIYGCDVCQQVCPHNRHPVLTSLPGLLPRPVLKELTLDRILSLSQTEFSAIFRNSPVKRTKLTGLLRNAHAIAKFDTKDPV